MRSAQGGRERRGGRGDGPSPPERLWRLLAACSLPPMLGLWALWREVYLLDADGLQPVGGAAAVAEWAALAAGTGAALAAFWARSRALRVLGYTTYALVLSVAFGAAGVLAVMHAFGGPSGRLAAPGWAIAALALVAALCVASLLATAALVVADVRAGDAEQEHTG